VNPLDQARVNAWQHRPEDTDCSYADWKEMSEHKPCPSGMDLGTGKNRSRLPFNSHLFWWGIVAALFLAAFWEVAQ